MNYIDYIYDLESYPNIFTASFKRVTDGTRWRFEISDRRNDILELKHFIEAVANTDGRLVGFNNLGYDYPVLHEMLTHPAPTAMVAYEKTKAIMNMHDTFTHMVWESDWLVPQLDLYKIHHFDNKAKMTSLKMLEFNMRSSNIEDLPFPPGTYLTHKQMDELIVYNDHDVDETEAFYHKSKDEIVFREELSARYNRNFINYNDTKIGEAYLIMRLEEAGIACYEGKPRKPRGTFRSQIALRDAIFPYVQFTKPEFQRVHQWLQAQVIAETKGLFKDLNATINGFSFVFGLGGIHGSVSPQTIYSDETHVIIDLDVASYYPNIVVTNRIYPEHLSEVFCDIVFDIFQQRKQHKKGTTENKMLKLALNGGVFGKSNSVYSPIYDPLYAMKITINGQLLLCMLAEHLMNIPGLQMIQANTDGVTVRIPRDQIPLLEYIREWWESFTCLELEEARYNRMFISDVNNYLAEYE